MDSERLKQRFDSWEARMRGDTVQPFRAPLEPEYRPLLGRERIHHGIVDDARTPGFFDRLARPKHREILGEPPSIPEPVPASGSGETVELQLLVRPDATFPGPVGTALLSSIASATSHVGFELVATHERIVSQLVCDERDREHVRTSLRTHVPDVQVLEARDYLWQLCQEEAWTSVRGFALNDRVFHKLRAAGRGEGDALAEIIGQMEEAKPGEVLLLQVLFAPTRSPWREDIEEFVSSIEDVDGVRSLVHEKFVEQIFAAGVRIAVRSPREDRARFLAERLTDALISVTRSPTNALVPLAPGTDVLDEELGDIVARQTRRSGMLLSLSELQTLVHLPSAAIRSTKLLRLSERTKAAPAGVASKGLILGTNEHDGLLRTVALSTTERLRHMHVAGSTGSGKSTLLLSMAIQDIEEGNGFAILDPHGDVIEDILTRIPEERAKDVVLFDPSDEAYPVAFNVLSAHSELEKTLLASDFVAIFRRLSSTTFGDVMVSVLSNAVLAILESKRGGTLLDLRSLLVDKAFRERYLETVSDEEVLHYWKREFPLIKGVPHSSILTRLNTFLRPKILRYIVAQQESRVDMRAIMDGKKILLAKLSRGLIGEENSHLLGSLLVAKIAQATVSRQDEEAAKRMPFTVYLDEGHAFATPSVADILSGARKYALSICFFHHGLRQLRTKSEEVADALLAHAYTRIVFQVGEQDARTFADGFSFFEARDLENLKTGEAIARIGRPDADFNLRTRVPDRVPTEVAARRRAAVRAASRAAFARPRTDVEEAIRVPEASAAVSAEVQEPVVRQKRAAKVSGDDAPMPGRGGAQHKHLQSLIRRIAEERGFAVGLEEEVLGGHGYVDIVLRREEITIACEVSVTTSVPHELANIVKCLAAGVDYAVLVSLDERMLTNARRDLAASLDPRIKLLSVDGLIAFLDGFAGRGAGQPALAVHRSGGTPKTAPPDAPDGPNERVSWLVAEDAASYVGLAKQTLAKMRVSGDGPVFHKIGRKVVYARSDLDAWMSLRKRRSTSDSGSGFKR
jgi:predicted DNA-binding transcriptional regulator AlpA